MNKVLSGKFSGKKIKIGRDGIYIKLSHNKHLILDERSLVNVKIINVETKKNFLNTYLRGKLSENCSESMYISSILSSNFDYTFLCKIRFRDNSVSIIQVKKKIFVNFTNLIDLDAG